MNILLSPPANGMVWMGNCAPPSTCLLTHLMSAGGQTGQVSSGQNEPNHTTPCWHARMQMWEATNKEECDTQTISFERKTIWSTGPASGVEIACNISLQMVRTKSTKFFRKNNSDMRLPSETRDDTSWPHRCCNWLAIGCVTVLTLQHCNTFTTHELSVERLHIAKIIVETARLQSSVFADCRSDDFDRPRCISFRTTVHEIPCCSEIDENWQWRTDGWQPRSPLTASGTGNQPAGRLPESNRSCLDLSGPKYFYPKFHSHWNNGRTFSDKTQCEWNESCSDLPGCKLKIKNITTQKPEDTF